MVNTPLPTSLKSEAKKAAKILSEFSIPTAKTGPDSVIPVGLLVNAEGLAIITVAKVGFLITARGGSGIVIAKLDNGEWSAPSAIGIAGLGGGLEIGAEVTDFVIILNKRTAVEAFSKGGNLTVGGNFTVAAGPLGRNVEGDISVRSPAAMYTYSKTKGLFAGISIEGSALIERKDANRKFYGEDIRAYNILNGDVERPQACWELYDILKKHKEILGKMALAMAKREATRQYTAAGGAAGIVSKVKETVKSRMSRKKSDSAGATRDSDDSSDDEPDSPPRRKFREEERERQKRRRQAPKSEEQIQRRRELCRLRKTSSHSLKIKSSPPVRTRTSSSPHRSNPRRGSLPQTSSKTKASPPPQRPQAAVTAMPRSKSQPTDVWSRNVRAEALYDFEGQMPCDLSFKEGEVFDILTRTHTQEDWWEGEHEGKKGIFPANYIRVI